MIALCIPHPEDYCIRQAGFVIAERPNRGPAIWVRNGKSYTHAEALRVARRELAARQEQEEITGKRGK